MIIFYIVGAIPVLTSEFNAFRVDPKHRERGRKRKNDTDKNGTSEKGGTFWTEGEAIATLLERDCGIASDILDAEQASIEMRAGSIRLIEFGFMASN